MSELLFDPETHRKAGLLLGEFLANLHQHTGGVRTRRHRLVRYRRLPGYSMDDQTFADDAKGRR